MEKCFSTKFLKVEAVGRKRLQVGHEMSLVAWRASCTSRHCTAGTIRGRFSPVRTLSAEDGLDRLLSSFRGTDKCLLEPFSQESWYLVAVTH